MWLEAHPQIWRVRSCIEAASVLSYFVKELLNRLYSITLRVCVWGCTHVLWGCTYLWVWVCVVLTFWPELLNVRSVVRYLSGNFGEQYENRWFNVNCLSVLEWMRLKLANAVILADVKLKQQCLKWETETQTWALLQHGSD